MKYVFCLVLLLYVFISHGQSINISVISSLGGQSSSGELSWTLGESFIGETNELSEGFHQGHLIVTPTIRIPEFSGIIAYPNPFQNGIFIKGDHTEVSSLQLMNATGKIQSVLKIDQLPLHIDLSSHPAGIYYLQLFSDSHLLDSFKIEKIK